MSLTYKDVGYSKAGIHWDALSGKLRVASIRRDLLNNTVAHSDTWSWTFFLSVAPDGFKVHGRVAKLEEARAQIEQTWKMWLENAQLGELVLKV